MRYLSSAALTLALLVPSAARADPGYYVVTAYDNAGQAAVDLRYWTVEQRGVPTIVWPEIGLAYGVTSRWTTELLTSYIGSSQMPMQRDSLNWINDVLLTQGEWPVDVAVHAQWVREADRTEGDALEIGPVLQTDVGRTQLNANLFFERRFHVAAPGPTKLKYQWQVKHRAAPQWQFGLQGFGELGPWDTWSPHEKQSHRAGPALFGTLPLGEGRSLQAQAAWLMGSVYGRSGNMLSLRVLLAF